jgi:DNA polymerase V
LHYKTGVLNFSCFYFLYIRFSVLLILEHLFGIMSFMDTKTLYKNQNKVYIAIDLKSFYASVECAALSLDPLDTNLVVADKSRTEKTICLAVSPSLKAYGIPGRARLFEVVEKVKQINAERRYKAPGHMLREKCCVASRLASDPSLELDYIVAVPKMAKYIEVSTQIYSIYLKYVAPEDIHVYSIDEVFIDATGYLKASKLTPHEFAMRIIRDVLRATGITATAGIGTNLYLCKIAMDIVAKHMPADEDGVRIAYLDEMSYRQKLWTHQPLTDFWRVGSGIAKKLIANGLYTMGDIARCSLGKPPEYYNEDLLYRLFGVNAELLIDHAWGYEPCTIADIKAYQPKENSLASGQVLQDPYESKLARLVLKEMAIQLAEDLLAKKLLTSQLVLSISYDIENLTDKNRAKKYKGEIVTDHYGRLVPKKAHGSINLAFPASLPSIIADAAVTLYDRIVNPDLLVRKLNITAAGVIPESLHKEECSFEQLNFFDDMDLAASGSASCMSPCSGNIDSGAAFEAARTNHSDKHVSGCADSRSIRKIQRELDIEHAVLDIKKKHGKNAMLKGLNLEDGATAIERNRQIGGHKA